jgi:hypothetical protein
MSLLANTHWGRVSSRTKSIIDEEDCQNVQKLLTDLYIDPTPDGEPVHGLAGISAEAISLLESAHHFLRWNEVSGLPRTPQQVSAHINPRGISLRIASASSPEEARPLISRGLQSCLAFRRLSGQFITLESVMGVVTELFESTSLECFILWAMNQEVSFE